MGNRFLDITVDMSIVASTGSLGFGYPLILASKQAKDIPYTKCSDLNEVIDVLKADTAYGAAGYASSDIYKAAQLMFMQEHKPSEIAICASKKPVMPVGEDTGILASLVEKDWRQLVCFIGDGDTTTEEQISDFIETQDYKMYFVSNSDIDTIGDFAGNKRTVAFFYADNKGEENPYAVAALVGEAAGQEVGSFTYKNLILKGIDPLDITSQGLSELNAANAITLVEKCGDNVTTEGKTCSGEYIDIVDSIDFIVSQIEFRVQKLLNKAPKIPYTDSGIAGIEAEVVSVLEHAFRNGIIADKEGEPQYSTNFKTREEMSAEDRANRVYTGGNFSFDLAGAIHSVHISGQLII